MRATRSDKGKGRVYDEPLTKKQISIRYVNKYLSSGKTLPHGKTWCYAKLGCRCDECKRAMSAYQKLCKERRLQRQINKDALI